VNIQIIDVMILDKSFQLTK